MDCITFSHHHPAQVASGRKTQTRRTIKEKQPREPHYIQRMWGRSPPPKPVDFGTPGLFCEVGPDYPDDDSDLFKCPYGKPGDQLWVKEGWGVSLAQSGAGWADGGATLTYRADGFQVPLLKSRFDLPATVGQIKNWRAAWRSPRFMPRWASRSTIELLDIRAEQLGRISEADCIAEGVERLGPKRFSTGGPGAIGIFETAQEAYRVIWLSVNGADSWKSELWVWALTFRRTTA